MNERSSAILANYDFQVIRTSRVRGATLCDTNRGLKILREYKGTLTRLTFEEELLRKINETELVSVDQIVANREGGLLSVDQDGTGYIVKDWYTGREPALHDKEDIQKSAALLGRLHKTMNQIDMENTIVDMACDNSLACEYEKHLKEIKRARNFIKAKRRKQEFEIQVLDCYNQFCADAMEAIERLGQSSYCELSTIAKSEKRICHGAYNYHNICICNRKMVVLNFDKAKSDLQIRDLYDYLRKVMEKNDWDVELGNAILEAYNKEKPISDRELETLDIMLCYPEKFWKIINYYFNTNKAWISEKNMEKLQNICCQQKMKAKFTLFLNQNIVQ